MKGEWEREPVKILKRTVLVFLLSQIHTEIMKSLNSGGTVQLLSCSSKNNSINISMPYLDGSFDSDFFIHVTIQALKQVTKVLHICKCSSQFTVFMLFSTLLLFDTFRNSSFLKIIIHLLLGHCSPLVLLLY